MLITADGVLKITDFGIARVAATSGARRSASGGLGAHSGTVSAIGTYEYMAPEQFDAGARVDARADLFAMGVCLYELFCGRRPYEMATGTPQRPPEPATMPGNVRIPRRLARLLQRTVEWDASARPSSAQEVACELNAIYEESVGEPSRFADSSPTELSASAFNNRAVSYLALGRVAEAEAAWQEALTVDPNHVETIYNQGLHQWRLAQTDDEHLVSRLRQARAVDTGSSRWLAPYLEAEVHLERGDTWAATVAIDGAAAGERTRSEIRRARARIDAGVAPGGGGFNRWPAAGAAVADNDVLAVARCDGILTVLGLPDEERWDEVVYEPEPIPDDPDGFSRVVSVLAVAISRDGGSIVTGGGDGSVKLWDARSKSCICTWPAHAGVAAAVDLDSDRPRVLSAGGDGAVRLWQPGRSTELLSCSGHSGAVGAARFVPKSNQALSASADRTLRLWDLDTGRCVAVLEGHDAAVRAVALTRDGRQAVSGDDDGVLKRWDLERSVCVRTGRVSTRRVDAVCLTRSERFVVAGSGLSHVWWEMATGRVRRTHRDPRGPDGPGPVVAICPDSEGQVLAYHYGGAYRYPAEPNYRAAFRVSKTSPGGLLAAEERYRREVSAGRAAAARGECGFACRFFRAARQVAGRQRAVEAVEAWGGLYTRLRRTTLEGVWPHSTLSPAASERVVSEREPALPFDADGPLACNVPIRDAGASIDVGSTSYRIVGRGDGDLTVSIAVGGATVGADSRRSLCGRYELRADLHGYRYRVWNVAEDKPGPEVEGRDLGFGDQVAALAADGRHVVVGGSSGMINIVDAGTGQCVTGFLGHNGGVAAVGLSPDSRYLVSRGRDGGLRAWFLDWELEESEPRDWDEGARPYLEAFLRPPPLSAAEAARGGNLEADPAGIECLLLILGCAGFGWLSRAGVVRVLARMASRRASL